MDTKNKIVLICNNQVLMDMITSGLEKGSYIIENTDAIYRKEKLEKYSGSMKLAVIEISKLKARCTTLLESMKAFQKDDKTAFLLICSSKQQDIAVEAVRMGAIDVVMMPCEMELIQRRINNILKIINLKRQVLKDPLTNIYNRAAFEDMVRQLLRHNKNSAAFMMIDLDDFKNLNDTFGHAVGDIVLIKVAKALEEAVEPQDIIGRMGGDEFAVFIPDISSKACFKKRVTAILNKLRIEFEEKGKKVSVFSSVGISFFPEHGMEFAELYRNADRAQYQSKNTGKNKFKVYGN
ncbi:GGDEF domain-containing protein [Aminipila sp.]|uniref:GGDEF domain-containing protein n=1 Tax=Aminipila sp. TaxID=2060095 RepID=UPI002897F73D|nr:diguanylate cyclase [Aminipila sp.]